MREHLPPTRTLPDRVAAVSPCAVLGLRDAWLLPAVRTAVGASGFEVADVARSTTQLLDVTVDLQPRLVVVALDVLGAAPVRTIQRTLGGSPGTSVVVLSDLDALPVWVLEAGAAAVVTQTDISVLKQVLRDLREP